MIILKQKEVTNLLQLIANPLEREIIELFLKDLETVDLAQNLEAKDNFIKHKSARKVLDIICRVGLEFGKHELIEAFLHLFD